MQNADIRPPRRPLRCGYPSVRNTPDTPFRAPTSVLQRKNREKRSFLKRTMQRLFAIPLRRHESEFFQSVAFRLFRGAADSDDAVFLIGEKFSVGEVFLTKYSAANLYLLRAWKRGIMLSPSIFVSSGRGDDLPARLAESIHRGDQSTGSE